MNSPKPRVFISYSHKDRDLLVALKAQLKALEQAGLLDAWEDTRIDAGDKWYPEIEAAMQGATVAVCLVSEYFLASDFCTKEEVPFLLKRAEEDGLLLIPVLLSDCPWYAHRWVEERQMLPGDGQSVRSHFATNPAAVFSKVAKRVYDKLNDPNYQPPKARVAWPALAPDQLDLTRLPETGGALFGRDQELELLDSAWSSAAQAGSTRTCIVAFTANGGVGKSTLVNHWLRDMQRDHFRGATRVFGWSFYSQGVREEGMASADTFIDAALRFFAGPDSTAGTPRDRGLPFAARGHRSEHEGPQREAERRLAGGHLAKLVGEQRSLLILDGLEPLQSAQTFERGKLRDPALQSLLNGLALRSDGLCVVTTREPLLDLGGLASVAAHDLERITPEAGRVLLRMARVVGTDAELEDLSRRFGLHALTVSLLGVFLYEKDPAHGTGPARALEQLPGATPIDRVLAGFEELLAGSAELEVLRLLGLFDQPADQVWLGALRAEPAIPGLTDRLVTLTATDWSDVLARLEKLRLIHVQRRDNRESIDAHPLLREHFAAQLGGGDADARQAAAWRAAHRRLYEHLRDTTEYQPDGLDGLQPLYQAVAHGCQAGQHQEACHDVYLNRILRGKGPAGFYSTQSLGAFGSDLAAIRWFFEEPWEKVTIAINDQDRAWLLVQAAYCLRVLGRLKEARAPTRAGMQMAAGCQDFPSAASAASNLSVLELTLGEVTAAVAAANQSVSYADRSGDDNLRMVARKTKAEALHQGGDSEAAESCFREADQVYVFPHSFRFCELLLASAERAAWAEFMSPNLKTIGGTPLSACDEAKQRAEQALWWSKQEDTRRLHIALSHLTLGRAALYESRLLTGQDRAAAHHDARKHIPEAVEGLRRSGRFDNLPRAVLTRAWYFFAEATEHRLRGNVTQAVENEARARADLDEAWQIAERGSMRLFMADIHLHRARLFRDKSELSKARALIEECGYWRRKEELEDAEAAAGSW